MERVVLEKKDTDEVDLTVNEAHNHNNFDKLQEHLYSKFNNAELNRHRITLKNHNRTVSAYANTRADLFDNRLEARDDNSESSGQRNPLRDIQTPSYNGESATKTVSELDASPSRSSPRTLIRRRKEKKVQSVKKINGKPDQKKLITTDKYDDNPEKSPEKQINEMLVDDDEERRYLQQLNRNIKPKRPRTASSLSSFKSTLGSTIKMGSTLGSMRNTNAIKNMEGTGYVDIDDFFGHCIDNRNWLLRQRQE